MTTYTLEVHMHDSDAPGLQAVTDIVWSALAKHLRLTEDELTVIVTGPPELRIGFVER